MHPLNWIAFILVLLLGFQPVVGTDSPVIGILGDPSAQGCDVLFLPHHRMQLKHLLEKQGKTELLDGGSCFAAYYVNWIEAGGGRVVPIRFNSSKEELDYLFSRLNGLLLTGGGLPFDLNTTYVQTANYLFQLATQPNMFFPIWGTCQGFQMLHVLAAKDSSVITVQGFDSEDISWPLYFTNQALSSRLLGFLPPNLQTIFQTERVTMNFHHDGVTPETFNTNQKIYSFFNSLSTNVDRKGRAFISTVEAKNFPIYATQWHPERQQFEFNTEDVGLVHTLHSVQANAAMAQFFVNEARKNNNKFESEDELEKYLIYKLPSYYLGKSLQVYAY